MKNKFFILFVVLLFPCFLAVLANNSPQINITYPKANDVLIVGETYDITWTAKNLEEGSIEIRDASELLATLSRDETSFEWIATNANTIKVLNVDDDGNEVVSDSVDFDIDALKLKLVFPREVDTLVVGETYNIKWRARDLEGDTIEIRDASELLATLSKDKTSFEWTIPASYEYKSTGTLKILNLDSKGNTVESDSVDFNVGTPKLEITFPKENNVFVTGKTYEIKWTAEHLTKDYIEIHSDSGILGTVSKDKTSFSWTVPQSSKSTDSRIIWLLNKDSTGTLIETGYTFLPLVNNDFYQALPITELDKASIGNYPDEFTFWAEVHYLNVDIGPISNDYEIILLENAGASTSGNALSKITLKKIGIISDLPRINIIFPKDGDVLEIGETYDITWTAHNLTEGDIQIFDGSDKYLGTVSKDKTSFKWVASDTDMIQVVNVDNSNDWTTLDSASFTAIKKGGSPPPASTAFPEIKITFPTINDVLTAGQTYTITWTAKDLEEGEIKVYDGTGKILGTLKRTETSLKWTIPKTNTGVQTIKVSNIDSNGSTLESDSIYFKVEESKPPVQTGPAPKLKITFPTETDILLGDKTYDITWTLENIKEGSIEIYDDTDGNFNKIATIKDPKATLYQYKAPKITEDTESKIFWIVSVDKNGEAQASDYVSFDIMKEEDVKKFGAVKVVENYLPTSITFWAEAFCPGSRHYPYVVPAGYEVVERIYGGVGTHGGRSYCVMTRITLRKKLTATRKPRELILPESNTLYYLDDRMRVMWRGGGSQLTVRYNYTQKIGNSNITRQATKVVATGLSIDSVHSGIGTYTWTVAWDNDPLPEGNVDICVGNLCARNIQLALKKDPPCGNVGDVDFDGSITKRDATQTTLNVPIKDVSGDCRMTLLDNRQILEYVRDSRETFPACEKTSETKIYIKSPTHGSTVEIGEEYTIEWEVKNLADDNIYIFANADLIKTFSGADSFKWTVPERYGDCSTITLWVGNVGKSGNWARLVSITLNVKKK